MSADNSLRDDIILVHSDYSLGALDWLVSECGYTSATTEDQIPDRSIKLPAM